MLDTLDIVHFPDEHLVGMSGGIAERVEGIVLSDSDARVGIQLSELGMEVCFGTGSLSGDWEKIRFLQTISCSSSS